jgi:hypothetical protein
MAEALEERGTKGIIDRDVTFEVLKKEVEVVEAEKTQLAKEVAGLHMARADFEDL